MSKDVWDERKAKVAAEKVRAVGRAAVQLEQELIDEGKPEVARRFADAIATLPVESMARLYDILTK